MSHSGNWHRSPRKMALEIARGRVRAARWAAADIANTSPEHTCWLGWHELKVTCGGCGFVREFRSLPVSPRLYTAPWSEVAKHLVCGTCGAPAAVVTFGRRGPGGSEVMAELRLAEPNPPAHTPSPGRPGPRAPG